MKKLISMMILLVVVLTTLFASLPNEEGSFEPNSIILCFTKEAINSNVGAVNISTENGCVQIGVKSFDQLAKKYEFTSLERRYWVADQEWCDTNGAFPMNIFKVVLKDSSKLEEAISALEKDTNIIFAEHEAIMKFDFTPNDPLANLQYHLDKLQAYDLWDIFKGDSTIVVGIVDSGTKWNHEDLRANIWINQAELNAGMSINWETGEILGGNNMDDNVPPNGKADDLIGWDFWGTNSGSQDNNPYQNFDGENNHGTHVAGCVGAVSNNGLGVASIPMKVKLMISKHSSNTTNEPSVHTGESGIYYCADSGADIINCSWGGRSGSSASINAVNYAFNKGSLVIAAAGNDNLDHATSHHWPSDAPNAICIAATDQNDQKASFSDYGTDIDLCSPGVAIRSTIYSASGASTYAAFDGTSMASPVAAGVAAMVKATHPNYTPAQIRTRLLDTADEIPQMVIGETYYGKLGAGRVNAFKSILSDVVPNLKIIEKLVEEDQGDGDGQPNIGELIRLKVKLENEYGWINATDIVAKIRNPFDNGVVITDSVLIYNTITQGFNSFSTNFAKFQVPANYPDMTIPLVLSLSATANNNFNYQKNIEFTIDLSLNQANWPFQTDASITATPLTVSLKNDGNKMVIFGDQSGLLHCLNADKTELNGFPVDLQSTISIGVAAANITGDDKPEIVATTQNGGIYLVDNNGQIIASTQLEGTVKSQTMIADVNGDGQLEVIAGTQTRKLFVLNGATLQPLTGFPIDLGAPIIASMTVADVNGDDINDILVATTNSLHAINVATQTDITGWPYALTSPSNHGPSVGNFDSNLDTKEIVIAGSSTSNAQIVILNSNGTVLSSTTTPSAVKTEISVINMNNDNINEIAYVDYTGNLFVRNGELVPLEGYPKQVSNSNFEGSLVVLDLNNDGSVDFGMGDNTGNYYLVSDNNTTTFPGFPVHYFEPIKVSAVVDYLDDDQDIEFIFPVLNKMICIDYKQAARNIQWGKYRQNNCRTANVYYAPQTNQTTTIPSINNKLSQNYPNPFNPVTSISFTIKEKSNVKLSIYNIKGQLVKTLKNEVMASGKHSIVWNGKDNNNQNVTSGVYFYKIDSNNFSSTRKMILMK